MPTAELAHEVTSTGPVSPEQNLRTAQDTFIRRWGEMGQTWGINMNRVIKHKNEQTWLAPMPASYRPGVFRISQGATLVGLTATPAAHTYAFFHKNVVSEYTHTQAVRDRVNDAKASIVMTLRSTSSLSCAEKNPAI